MKNKLIYLIPILLLAACTGDHTTDQTPPDLFPQPNTVSVNTGEGYALNTVTGDSIQPIINNLGDTVITGVPIPAVGKLISPNSVAKPKSYPVPPPNQLTNKTAHPSVHLIPKELTVIPVNNDSLTTILLEEIAKNDTTHYLVNRTGDTVKTGIPIPALGKTVPTSHPKPTPALPLRIKEAATSNLQYLDVDQGMASSYVLSITEDKSGNLWFGTDGGGVSRYDGTSFTHFTTKEGLSDNIVNSIMEDKSGNLWFGTWGGGVSRYDGNSFTHFTTKEGLSNNYVLSITEDKSGNLWIGTDGGGVSRYDGTSFTHFTTKEGLSNNTVWSITEDKSGNLWCSTESGLTSLLYDVGDSSKTEKAEDNKTATLVSLMKNDGLKGMDFFTTSNFMDSKNRMWWGSGKSLTMLDLNNYALAKKPPVAYLNQLDINERFIDYRNLSDSPDSYREGGMTFDSVQAYRNYPLNLEVPYHQNHLTFHFSGIDWEAPHKIQYSYVLDGLNTQWSKASSEPKADYRNLSYGTYTFKLRTIGESGQWSEAFENTFTINPPWWHTWWARIIYAILALLSIIGIVRWRTASLKQRQIELEIEVDNATTEIREQKDEIEKEKDRSEELLLNILPEEVAQELKEKGAADAQLIDHVTVLFTDFKGFTSMSEKLSPKELVADLHACFSEFDKICEQHGIEKIKTIGDAYMAAGGLPTPNQTHPTDVVKAALEMAEVVERGKAEKIAANLPFFEVRIGVHTGPVVAGIVGVKKFQYDIWGDTVNTASRMESSGEIGRVNISQATYELLKDTANSGTGEPQFSFESRGKIEAKGKGEIEMYFVSHSSKSGG